jgi:hypothetical protein
MTDRPNRRILMTNIRLDGRSGTEIVVKETAIGLTQRGHRVAVYAPSKLGSLAQELIGAGVIVTSQIETLQGFAPDLLQGNHTAPFLTARSLFPTCPALWFCHDAISWHDDPPVLPDTAVYVATSPATQARLLSAPGIPENRVVILGNATEVQPVAGPAPETIRNVLIVAKYNTTFAKTVLAACKEMGLKAEIVGGGTGQVVSDLAERMGKSDLVVTSGKAAMEALVLNRPVLCADERGMAGLITQDVAPVWLARNLGGMILHHKVRKGAVIAEIALYDPADFARMRAEILPRLSLERYLDDLESLHARALAQKRKHDRVALARSLEQSLPSYRSGGHYPWQTYELEARIAAQARELAAVRAEHFDFGPEPPFARLEFGAGKAGSALLEKGWGPEAKTQDRGVIRIPAPTGWARGRRFKIEGELSLPETENPAPEQPLALRVRVNGTPCALNTAPEHVGRRKGYLYFWFDHGLAADQSGDALIEIAPQGQGSSASFRITGLTLTLRAR